MLPNSSKQEARRVECGGLPPHGDYRRYKAGCKCDQCRRANRLRVTRWRMSTKHSTQPVHVPMEASRRRLQALCALGFSLRQVSDESGIPLPSLKAIVCGRFQAVHRDRAAEIAAVYSRLSGVRPDIQSRYGTSSTRNRTKAARKGWPTPLAWDDIDNDAEPSDFSHLERMLTA